MSDRMDMISYQDINKIDYCSCLPQSDMKMMESAVLKLVSEPSDESIEAFYHLIQSGLDCLLIDCQIYELMEVLVEHSGKGLNRSLVLRVWSSLCKEFHEILSLDLVNSVLNIVQKWLLEYSRLGDLCCVFVIVCSIIEKADFEIKSSIFSALVDIFGKIGLFEGFPYSLFKCCFEKCIKNGDMYEGGIRRTLEMLKSHLVRKDWTFQLNSLDILLQILVSYPNSYEWFDVAQEICNVALVADRSSITVWIKVAQIVTICSGHCDFMKGGILEKLMSVVPNEDFPVLDSTVFACLTTCIGNDPRVVDMIPLEWICSFKVRNFDYRRKSTFGELLAILLVNTRCQFAAELAERFGHYLTDVVESGNCSSLCLDACRLLLDQYFLEVDCESLTLRANEA